MTTKLFDIFSKRKIELIEKPKVIIDYRERSSLVPKSLEKLGLEVEFKELKVADYIINNVAIERKTISDFISSMINKRLLRQLEELQQYKKKLLIIEGIEENELYNDHEIKGVNPNAIRGFILSITLKHKIPLILTKNSEDTARFISVLSRRKEREIPLNVSKKNLNKRERLQFILEGFPGIGPKAAQKLFKKFKTLKNIINASQEELKGVVGKKAEVFKISEKKY